MNLRPLGVGEVIDHGFRLVRGRFGTLALCALAVAGPLSIVRTLVLAATDDTAFTTRATTSANGSLAGGAVLSWLIGVLIVLLVLAACFRAISTAYLGEQATARESLAFALARLPALLGCYVLVTATVLVGLILLIVPGLYLGVVLSVALPALLFERIGPVDAYRRSFALVSGNWWRTFGVLLLAALIFWGVSFVVGLVFGAVAPDGEAAAAVVFTVIDILLSVVLYPVAAGILTVLYYDLRVRNEGFDLEGLAHGVERRAPAGWEPPRPPRFR